MKRVIELVPTKQNKFWNERILREALSVQYKYINCVVACTKRLATNQRSDRQSELMQLLECSRTRCCWYKIYRTAIGRQARQHKTQFNEVSSRRRKCPFSYSLGDKFVWYSTLKTPSTPVHFYGRTNTLKCLPTWMSPEMNVFLNKCLHVQQVFEMRTTVSIGTSILHGLLQLRDSSTIKAEIDKYLYVRHEYVRSCAILHSFQRPWVGNWWFG